MTADRFSFQRNCVMDTEGIVLNIGANEDPAGLRALAPDRVLNCDIEDHDSFLNRPNRVDRVFDARQRWPFADDSVELVVLGDILEHLYRDEAEEVLRESYRVAEKLCITVPEDDRFLTEPETWEDYTKGIQEAESGYRTHCEVVSRHYLQELLDLIGWKVDEWIEVDYVFVPKGHFVTARKENNGTG